MSDKSNKSKMFVVVISVMVIVLIIIGCIFTWKIMQKGQESSVHLYEVDQYYLTEPMDFHYKIK